MYIICLLLATNFYFFPINTFSELLYVQPTLPRVFMIGSYEAEYEKLIQKYKQNILEANKNDIANTYQKLNSMYEEMYAHADYVGVNIDGVRVWFYFFWNQEGNIDYMCYHLRPNSKNIDLKEFESFLLSFVQSYRFPLQHTQAYSLYTSTAFPPYYKKMPKN